MFPFLWKIKKDNGIWQKYKSHIILEAILELRQAGNIVMQYALSTLNLSFPLCVLKIELFSVFIEIRRGAIGEEIC